MLTTPLSPHEQVWRAALGELELSVTQSTYDTWLKPTYAIGFEGDTLLLGAPSAYYKDWLENRLGVDVRRALARVTARPVDFRVLVGGKTNGAPTRPASEASHGVANGNGSRASHGSLPGPTQPPLGLERPDLNPRYTFSTYVVGASNRLAHAAANAVAEGPSARYNPLCLYGGVGLGKTHLLHAIGHKLAGRDSRVRYVTSETFTNDLISAIRTHTTEEFRNRYRQVDVLLLDDVQFLIGKDSTQEELFHTFNAMYSANRQIVISSDRHPHALVTLEARLRSRFEGGLLADIQPPDLEMRLAILQGLVEKESVRVPDVVVDMLAHRIQTNTRELVGALTQVVGYAQLMHTPLTADVAERVLASSTAHRRAPPAEAVLRAVADFYGVTTEDLTGKRRVQRIVVPRHVAMYIMREDGRLSLPQIGQVLNRDHTTVLHGVEKMTEQIDRDEALRRDVLSIREGLFRGGSQ